MLPIAQKLTYFLSEKKSILIVSLVGPLMRESAAIFEECIKEVEASGAKWVILNFRDVPHPIDSALFPPIARLQKLIRSKTDTHLVIASMHPELKKILLEAGLLRPEELSNNLSDALGRVSQELKQTG